MDVLGSSADFSVSGASVNVCVNIRGWLSTLLLALVGALDNATGPWMTVPQTVNSRLGGVVPFGPFVER
jgi:hypothetical protein